MHEIHPPTAAEYIRFLPETILTIFGVIVMVLEAITNERQKRSLGFLALAGVLAAMLAAAYAYGSAGQAFQNMITVDGYGTFFIELVLAIGCLTLLASFAYLK